MKSYNNLINLYTNPKEWAKGYLVSNILENIKKENYNGDILVLDESFVSDLENDGNFKKETYNIKIPAKYIEEDVQELVDSIIDEILKSYNKQIVKKRTDDKNKKEQNKIEDAYKKILTDIDVVYFTGRNFMFKLFKNKMEENIKEIVYCKKTVCLRIPFTKKTVCLRIPFTKIPAKIVAVKNVDLKTLSVKIQSPTNFETNDNSGLMGQQVNSIYDKILIDGEKYYYLGMQTEENTIVNINNINMVVDIEERPGTEMFEGKAILEPGIVPPVDDFLSKLEGEIDNIIIKKEDLNIESSDEEETIIKEETTPENNGGSGNIENGDDDNGDVGPVNYE